MEIENAFTYQNFKPRRSKKNHRRKNKWVIKENTAADIISYVEEKR